MNNISLDNTISDGSLNEIRKYIPKFIRFEFWDGVIHWSNDFIFNFEWNADDDESLECQPFSSFQIKNNNNLLKCLI